MTTPGSSWGVEMITRSSVLIGAAVMSLISWAFHWSCSGNLRNVHALTASLPSIIVSSSVLRSIPTKMPNLHFASIFLSLDLFGTRYNTFSPKHGTSRVPLLP